MKSEFFKDFGIPVAECEIEPRLDDLGVAAMDFLAHVGLSRPAPEFDQTDPGVVSGHLP